MATDFSFPRSPLLDAAGTMHVPARDSVRIVSLVPSLTELLLDLDLGPQVVGRTGFCIHPRDRVREIPKVGGTKDPDVERIRALAPTHLIVNIDENERPAVETLAAFVPSVVVTHPQTPEDNRGLYRLMGALFSREPQAERLETALDDALRSMTQWRPARPVRVLYAIWRDPWMTVSADTYVGRSLAAAGMQVVDPRPPHARDATRYPAFELDTVDWSGIDVLLLSTEPYVFRPRHVEALRDDPRLMGTLVELVDGEAASWYGSRAPRLLPGLAELAALLARRLQDARLVGG